MTVLLHSRACQPICEAHRSGASATQTPSTDISGILEKGTLEKMESLIYDSDTYSLAVAAVNKYLDELGRLDAFAGRAASAVSFSFSPLYWKFPTNSSLPTQIEQLLDLKHKQSLLSIYSETEKQGKTIMYFTIVTIVFVSFSTPFNYHAPLVLVPG